MIVDTSAIVAILAGEPEREEFLARLAEAPRVLMSAGNWIELSAVVTRSMRKDHALKLDGLFEDLAISIAPVTVTQAEIGCRAYREYGRGTDHPAYFNFGDCFAYALAKDTGEPLLFKGDGFSRTDITPAR
ncbi:type II toxin-antitoxin system VapC family toxin [Sphingomonas sp. DT-204]|uniref:type II toxin-antitoxin system VapC family toxin n=1 Tax=Sphingomonas sp. DT-204 TaxID=3396166 RepID=UPI003F1C6473